MTAPSDSAAPPYSPYDIATVRRSHARATVAYSGRFFPSRALPTLIDAHPMAAIERVSRYIDNPAPAAPRLGASRV
jgi:hypothetical protein